MTVFGNCTKIGLCLCCKSAPKSPVRINGICGKHKSSTDPCPKRYTGIDNSTIIAILINNWFCDSFSISDIQKTYVRVSDGKHR